MLKAGLELTIPLGWFPEDRSKVINETSVMMSDGQTRRPDRVVNDDGKINIVDFKFGAPTASYESQVKEYADLWDIRTSLPISGTSRTDESRRCRREDKPGSVTFFQDGVSVSAVTY